MVFKWDLAVILAFENLYVGQSDSGVLRASVFKIAGGRNLIENFTVAKRFPGSDSG